VQPLI
jgi:hypothetical protein